MICVAFLCEPAFASNPSKSDVMCNGLPTSVWPCRKATVPLFHVVCMASSSQAISLVAIQGDHFSKISKIKRISQDSKL